MLFKQWKPVLILIVTFLGVCPVFIGHAQDGSGKKCFADNDLSGKTYDEIIQALVVCHSNSQASNEPTSTQRSTETHQKTTSNDISSPPQKSVRTDSSQVRTARKDVTQGANCSVGLTEEQYRYYLDTAREFVDNGDQMIDDHFEIWEQGQLTEDEFLELTERTNHRMEQMAADIEAKLSNIHACLKAPSISTRLNLTQILIGRMAIDPEWIKVSPESENELVGVVKDLENHWKTFKRYEVLHSSLFDYTRHINTLEDLTPHQKRHSDVNTTIIKTASWHLAEVRYRSWKKKVEKALSKTSILPPPDLKENEYEILEGYTVSYPAFPDALDKITRECDPELVIFGLDEACLIKHFYNVTIGQTR